MYAVSTKMTMEYQTNLHIMAVDPGTKRWGVAVGDTAIGTARPFLTIERDFDSAILEIVKLYKKERADYLVLGRPVHMDGSSDDMTFYADRAFAALQAAGVKVIAYDERLTSFAAEEIMKRAGIKYTRDKALVDRVAAAVILESAFNDKIFDQYLP